MLFSYVRYFTLLCVYTPYTMYQCGFILLLFLYDYLRQWS